MRTGACGIAAFAFFGGNLTKSVGFLAGGPFTGTFFAGWAAGWGAGTGGAGPGAGVFVVNICTALPAFRFGTGIIFRIFAAAAGSPAFGAGAPLSQCLGGNAVFAFAFGFGGTAGVPNVVRSRGVLVTKSICFLASSWSHC